MPVDVEILYTRYGGMVHRRCLHLLRDQAQADDALHDVFVQVLRHADRLDLHAPSALLFQISTRVCLNRLRTRARHPEDADDALLLNIASAEGLEARSIARGLLERLFGQVPVDSRTLAVMHLLDGMTLEEVAEEVGMSVSGVRKRLRQLRAHLKLEQGDPA